VRPKLKISNLISLQDARSSAAVGFDLISFSLERGSHHKLSVSLAWNIIQWISGPAIVVELNRASLPELTEAQQTFSVDYATLPLDEWSPDMQADLPPVILRGDHQADPQRLAEWLAAAPADRLFLELSLPSPAEAERFAPVAERSLFHFHSIEMAEEMVQTSQVVPWGFAFYQEAQEEPGVLDYERIDDFLELFNERFEED